MPSSPDSVGVENITAVLAASVAAADVSFSVQLGGIGPGGVPADLGALFPTSNFQVRIDNEIITVGSRSGDTFSSLTRGDEGTVAASHPAGASVEYVVGGREIAASGSGGSQTLAQVLALGNDAGGAEIANLADPAAAQDAATKAYVDLLISPRPVLAALSSGNTAAQNLSALQTMISSARTNGGDCVIPEGLYNIAGGWSISPWNGMCLRGAGVGRSVLVNTSTDGSTALTLLGMAGKAWDVSLRDFELDGNASSGDGLHLGDSTGATLLGPVEVIRVRCLSHGGNGFVLDGLLDQVYLRSVISRSNTGYGYYQASTKLISEVVVENSHFNANAAGGVLAGACASGKSLTIIGGEMSHNGGYNLDLNSAVGSGACPWLNMTGTYFEAVTVDSTISHIRVGGSGVPGANFYALNMSDGSTSGMAQLVLVRVSMKAMLFDGVSFGGKSGKPCVNEVGGAATKVLYRNCTLQSGMTLRLLADSSTTNVANGGPSTYRWTNATGGDIYYDTTLGKPVFYTGSGWVDATGTVA